MDTFSEQVVGDILVVDDDADINTLLTEALTDEGYAVRSAHDGLAGWQAIVAKTPAPLVTDIKMPVMTGVELVQQVRAAGYTFPILIIAATERLATPLLQLEGTAFVPKPFDLWVLLERIATLYGQLSRIRSIDSTIVI